MKLVMLAVVLEVVLMAVVVALLGKTVCRCHNHHHHHRRRRHHQHHLESQVAGLAAGLRSATGEEPWALGAVEEEQQQH